jgi:hypothetical protein
MALLTLSQQNEIKPISQNWANSSKEVGGTTNFEQLQKEVENLELRKLLGNALLYDIQQNPTDANNVLLLDGTTFEDCNGDTIDFQGIRFQLAYMNYSKYIRVSKLSDTYTGFVNKTRNESTDLDVGELKNEQQNNREIALSDFEIMKKYLDDNKDTYELWECANTKKVYTPRIKTVRKTAL